MAHRNFWRSLARRVGLLGMSVGLFLVSEQAAAQSAKYKRAKKSSAPAAEAPAAPSGAPSSAASSGPAAGDKPADAASGAAANATASGAPVAPGANGEKVDISDLEKRYWAPKDTDFSVVQNRQYSKEKRFGLTLGWGPVVNDAYSTGSVLGLALNYYPSERHGIELRYNKANLESSTITQAFISRYGTVPNHNQVRSFYGVAYNWIPIYAKMSLLDKRILYFDMSFSPGIGMTTYQHMSRNGDGAAPSAFTLTLDVSQHFFVSQNMAIRIDYRNLFFSEAVKEYTNGTDVQTQKTTTTVVLFGLTYYH